MTVKRIHINQRVIRANIKAETPEPPISVKTGNRNIYGFGVEILGPSRLVYSPHGPLLKCGARLVLETEAPVVIDGKPL